MDIEFEHPCPVCQAAATRMTALPEKLLIVGWPEPYPVTVITCLECRDKTTIGVGTRNRAVEIWNQLPRV